MKLIALVNRLMKGRYGSDEVLDREAAVIVRRLPHPRALDLIYHWKEEFDHEPTAEEVVERGLGYRPMEL